MIIYTKENLFLSPAQTLVNTVNTVGVMGKGIAKDFKSYYPRMFNHYKKYCENGQLNIGQLMLSKEEPVYKRRKKTKLIRNRWVLNFPTKKHWRAKSKIEYIEAGLDKFVHVYQDKDIKSISFPQLGVGNGGLQWIAVKELMEYYLDDLDIPVYIHIYHGNSDKYDKNDKTTIENNLNTPHDLWKQSSYLEQHGYLKSNEVNTDGIILPNSKTYKKALKLKNTKNLSLIDLEDKAIWLQIDSDINSESPHKKKIEQLTLPI